MNWTYKGKEITSIQDVLEYFPDLHEVTDLYGFVYILTYPNDKYYIGKKNFFFIKTLLSRVSKLPRPHHIRFFKKNKNHKRVEFEQFKVETDWLTYKGSARVEVGEDPIKKEMLEFAQTKRFLTYLEAKHLFQNDVLLNPKFINSNILGTFFSMNLLDKDEEIKELNNAKDPILWPIIASKE